MDLTEKLVRELKRIKHLGEDVKIHRAYLSPDRADILFATDDDLMRVEVSALSPEMAEEVLKPMVMIETKPLPEMTTLTEPSPDKVDEAIAKVAKGRSKRRGI